MGDMADFHGGYYDYGDEEEDFDNRAEHLASQGIWPAKYGEMDIRDMTDEHLENAINYVARHENLSMFRKPLVRERDRRYRTGQRPMQDEIKSQWESYRREVLLNDALTTQAAETEETEKAFYAGAKALLHLLRLNGELKDTLYPILLDQELDAFAARVDGLS